MEIREELRLVMVSSSTKKFKFPTEVRHKRYIFTARVQHPRTNTPISMHIFMKNVCTQEIGVKKIAFIERVPNLIHNKSSIRKIWDN